MTGRSEAGPIALEVAAAIRDGRQIAPFSARGEPVPLTLAYRVVAELRRLRGGRLVGRKIGFTNQGIWPRYGVSAPIWGDVLAETLHELAGAADALALEGFSEPRIEPEIVLGLGSAPPPDADEAALALCVAWIAPAFEIVQSVYPGWNFEIADTIVAGGLHGRLLLGERVPADRAGIDRLPGLAVRLLKDGAEVETGRGSNVLGGPLSALRHLVGLLAEDPDNPPLAAGEMVSTGTLTDAWPVAPGERWRAEFAGAALPAISARFA